MKEDETKEPEEKQLDLSDTIEGHPEFHDMAEDHNAEFFKENDPEFYELMKKAGLNDGSDERTTEED